MAQEQSLGAKIKQFYFACPIVTRVFLTSLLVTGLAIRVGYLRPGSIAFVNSLVFSTRPEVYRVLTSSICLGALTFSTVMDMYFLYISMSNLERGKWFNKPRDMLLAIGLAVLTFTLFGLMPMFATPWLAIPISSFFLMLFSIDHSEIQMSFMGILTYRSRYAPLVHVTLSFLMGEPIAVTLLGFLVGYAYHYVDTVLPKTHGMNILHKPRLWIGATAPNRMQRSRVRHTTPGGFEVTSSHKQAPVGRLNAFSGRPRTLKDTGFGRNAEQRQRQEKKTE